MHNNIKLELRLVGDIKEKFYVPSYQRGYRWTELEVTRLLDDIYNTKGQQNYCLQPIVIKKNGDRYELIDGQQRLTTIYLIYHYMNMESNGLINKPSFTISYETRKNSEEFLQVINESQKEENIDFYFFCTAYESIKKWFENKNKKLTITNINKYFNENIKIIWYEIDESENPIQLFTRLNRGKIPLTNAELVKAMFLKTDNSIEKREEIAIQWDYIEQELHEESFWYFLINKENDHYQTRIDLILDLISNKSSNEKEKYYTFFKFYERYNDESLNDIWYDVQHSFLILKDWYENHNFYHKIGYLISSNSYTLQLLFNKYKNKTKSEFQSILDKLIKDSIWINDNYSELRYDKPSDYKKMAKLLLLFNIESIRQNEEHSQWFPFDKYKSDNRWSLEHIHAQQSEGLSTQSTWKEWLNLHIPSVKAVSHNSNDLIIKMKEAIDDEKLNRHQFEEIQEKVIDILSDTESSQYMHSISNLALLSNADNAALNNSTFDVKRNKIIEMDKKGQFIPFCTRMVFLKYYTSSDNQLHFWGHEDRISYINEINKKLEKYLNEPIIFKNEEDEYGHY